MEARAEAALDGVDEDEKEVDERAVCEAALG